jgi:hypothetical protein
METEIERLVSSDEGDSNSTPAEATGEEPSRIPEKISGERQPPPGYEGVIQELWPDENGKPPELTEGMMRKLRGKYFTVRHPLLTTCGHKLDMINQPKTSCENCWWQFFNVHPQLVEVTDQFFRTQGKRSLISMRGKVYTKMFTRYMATVLHFMKEEKNVSEDNQPGRLDGTVYEEAGLRTAVAPTVEGREIKSSELPSSESEQNV